MATNLIGILLVLPQLSHAMDECDRNLRNFAMAVNARFAAESVMKVGTIVLRDGKPVLVTDGQYLSDGRISNFWYWRTIDAEGRLSATEEHGYDNEGRFKAYDGQFQLRADLTAAKVTETEVDAARANTVYALDGRFIYVMETQNLDGWEAGIEMRMPRKRIVHFHWLDSSGRKDIADSVQIGTRPIVEVSGAVIKVDLQPAN